MQPASRRNLNEMRLEWIQDINKLAALREEWGSLLERSEACVFNSWEWLFPWWKHLGNQVALRVLVGRGESNELRAVLPLGLREIHFAGLRFRRLGFLGDVEVGSDHLDLVSAPSETQEVAETCFEAVKRMSEEWDLLELDDLNEDSKTIAVIRESFPADRFTFELQERFICPYETLTPGRDFDSFLRMTRRCQNFLRRRRALQNEEGFRLEIKTDSRALEASVENFFRLHSQRRAYVGDESSLQEKPVQAFHLEAMKNLAEKKKLRLMTLFVREIPVASVYGICHRKSFLYYNGGFDPAWANRSVGLVLVGESFRHAIDNGCSEFDFLRGEEAYKFDWVKKSRRTVSIRIWKKGSKGEWLVRAERAWKGLKSFGKRHLPSEWLQHLRRLGKEIRERTAQ